MSHYQWEVFTFNEENIMGETHHTQGGLRGKIDWDKEVEFVFEEMKKNRVGRLNAERNKNKKCYHVK